MKKEKIKKLAVIAAFGLLFAAIITTYGCDGGKNPAGPSSDESCAGYGGGNEVGRWKSRPSEYTGFYTVKEYTGSIHRYYSSSGELYWEVSYWKPQNNKIVYMRDGRERFQCFEVGGGGNILRVFDGYYDRI